jgi:hypothetical protein
MYQKYFSVMAEKEKFEVRESWMTSLLIALDGEKCTLRPTN